MVTLRIPRISPKACEAFAQDYRPLSDELVDEGLCHTFSGLCAGDRVHVRVAKAIGKLEHVALVCAVSGTEPISWT